MLRFGIAFVFIAVLATSSVAAAQPSESDRARAAEAYDRGARAFRTRDFPESARWFERANHLAPSPIATVQAIRAHLRARNYLRAGTLALSLEGDAGLAPRVEATVREAIAAATSRYVRVEVECNATCDLTIDGERAEAPRFFLEPDREITVVATFETGTKTETVLGQAGTERTVVFEAPEGALSAETAAETTDENFALDDGDNPYRISRIAFLSRPRATFFITASAAMVIGGITVWSAIDTRESREARARAIDGGAPSTEVDALTAEHDRDVRRTHGYLGFSAVIVAATGLVAGFTDWTPERGDSGESSTDATLDASPTGATVTVRHRF